jgi:hypothetical protein
VKIDLINSPTPSMAAILVASVIDAVFLGRTQHPRPGPISLPLRGLPGCDPGRPFCLVSERMRGAVTTMQETVELDETEQAASRAPDGHPGSRLRSAWTLLKLAVKGTQQDYTEGSLSRAVFLCRYR